MAKISYEKFILENGLRILVHRDETTPMVAFNVLYDVGARDEDPEKTGFAHLFEHLMFGGSVNVPEYDTPLQMAGGENNAYTTNDITNYYIQVPKENLPTAFYLESDRMLSLAFSENSLEVQRKVVCEEFREHYINKPYGDAWKILRQLAYKQHPYQWMTIGKEIQHIEEAQLGDVKAFFNKHYHPANAVVCVAGNVATEEIKTLAQEWFGEIPPQPKPARHIPQEQTQQEDRLLEVQADVPLSALYKVWHVKDRLHADYQAQDLITEILGNGYASRLHVSLVKKQELFSSLSCYHTGSLDPGLLVIEGKVRESISIEEANAAVDKEIALFLQEGITEEELQKAKNKTEAMLEFEDMSLLSRANNLAFYELLGDANLINEEWNKYDAVTNEELMRVAKDIFRKGNCNTLFYRKKEA